MKTCETTDVFKTAYHLTQGNEIVRVRVRRQGRPRATFVLQGGDEELLMADLEYQTGTARVDPRHYKDCLNQVRDRLFEALYDEKKN